MVPRFIEFRADLPRTPTQKVRKVVLREDGITPATWDREAAGFKVTRDGLAAASLNGGPSASAAFAAYQAGNGTRSGGHRARHPRPRPARCRARTTSAASSPPTAAPSTGRARPSRQPRRSRPTRRACASPSAIWRSGRATTRRRSGRFARRWRSGAGLGGGPHQPRRGTASGRGGWKRPSQSLSRRACALSWLRLVGCRSGLRHRRARPGPAGDLPRPHRRAKLEHDLAQLGYLLELGRLPPSLSESREGLRRVLAGFGSEDSAEHAAPAHGG